MVIRLQYLKRACAPGRAFYADHRGLAEGHREAEILRERGLDDFLLHLAVEGNIKLLTLVVLAHVDERILLGDLAERRLKPLPVIRRGWSHDRLKCRRRKFVAAAPRGRCPDPVADPRLGETAEFSDLTSDNGLLRTGRPALEYGQRGHPGDQAGSETDLIAHPYLP